MHVIDYHSSQDAVTYQGIKIHECVAFKSFMANDVASRLHDADGKADLVTQLNSLTSTGFAQESLKAILEAEQLEDRDWAVSEALAEAWLSREHAVIWPWNMERDKRTAKASLPGADLVGFVIKGNETRLVLGEVKSSKDKKTPPGVMIGNKGMTHQLEALAQDLGLLNTLIRWLHPRCRGNPFEAHFKSAVELLFQSGNQAITLFGVLVRDTESNKQDLQGRAEHLITIVKLPAYCHLLALYLPCSIESLPDLVQASNSI